MNTPQTPLHEIRGLTLDYSQITPDQMRIIGALGDRASRIIGQYAREKRNDASLLDPDPMLLRMDFATTHIAVGGLRLLDWLHADDLTFADELGKMLAGINRPLCIFNTAFKLRFTVRPM